MEKPFLDIFLRQTARVIQNTHFEEKNRKKQPKTRKTAISRAKFFFKNTEIVDCDSNLVVKYPHKISANLDRVTVKSA